MKGPNDLLKRYPAVLLMAVLIIVVYQTLNSRKFYSMVRCLSRYCQAPQRVEMFIKLLLLSDISREIFSSTTKHLNMSTTVKIIIK
jgi:hypothetical protein